MLARRLNGRAKQAQRQPTRGPAPPQAGTKTTTTPKLKGAKMLRGKLTREKAIAPDCLLNQTSLVSNNSKENKPPTTKMPMTTKRFLRFPISIPGALKKRGAQEEKHEVHEGKQHGYGGSSSRFLSLFRKEEKELFDSSLDLRERQESSTGDSSVALETQEVSSGEGKSVQHDQLEDDQHFNDIVFLDRITVCYPKEEEYTENPIAVDEIETTYPYTIHDDFRLRSAYSEESIFNYYNDVSGAQFRPGSYPTWSRSNSFDDGMAGARVLLNFQQEESEDPLDFPFKSPPSLEVPQRLLQGSFSSDDLARYDRTAVMENMASNQQWSMDFDSISHHEHNGGFAMTKSRNRSDPSTISERSNDHTGGMAIVEVHCRSDPSLLGEHWGTAPSSRTPFRASPSFECMLGSKHTIAICNNEEMAPTRNVNITDASDSAIVKEEEVEEVEERETPVRNSMNIGDSGFHPLSITSRSRSEPNAVATSSSTSTQPGSSLETTVDMKRTRSAASMEKTLCLPRDGGNLLSSSEIEVMRRFHSQPETVRTSSKDGDLALPAQEFKDHFSRLVSSAGYDDDHNVVRVFSTLLSLDHMCPGDAIDAMGSEVGLNAGVETHFPTQGLKQDPGGSEVSASLSGAQSIRLDAIGDSTVSASPHSLMLDANGRVSPLSASDAHRQSLTQDDSGSSKNANDSYEQDLKVPTDGLKVAWFEWDSSLDDSQPVVEVCKDPSIMVKNHKSESCPKTESNSDGLLPTPSSEDFSALTVAHSMSSEDGLYLLTSVDVLEVDTSPTPVASGCLAMAANDIGRVARCETESRRLVSKPTCEYSVGDETATIGRDSMNGTLTEASSHSFALYGCLHPVTDVLPLYVDFCKSMME
jgi:hypothetical protein